VYTYIQIFTSKYKNRCGYTSRMAPFIFHVASSSCSRSNEVYFSSSILEHYVLHVQYILWLYLALHSFSLGITPSIVFFFPDTQSMSSFFSCSYNSHQEKHTCYSHFHTKLSDPHEFSTIFYLIVLYMLQIDKYTVLIQYLST
jgi:hypothetical protein